MFSVYGDACLYPECSRLSSPMGSLILGEEPYLQSMHSTPVTVQNLRTYFLQQPYKEVVAILL